MMVIVLNATSKHFSAYRGGQLY